MIHEVLGLLGVDPRSVATLKDADHGNRSWLVEPAAGRPVVLRRYHERATREDVAYEHEVLSRVAARGWAVPEAASELIEFEGGLYCLTRFVPGRARDEESAGERRRRGRDMARLQLALRDVASDIGQRPGWRPQHMAPTVHLDIDWQVCIEGLVDVDERLADWATLAASQVMADLDRLGAGDLPLTVVHGDFTSWNVHYHGDGRLAGVIDFGLTHLDSRPYELAIARTYRAPEAVAAYRDELRREGWPLTPLEESLLEPVARAFRIDMALWQMDFGRRTGTYDLAMIERQLQRTGTSCP